MNVFGKFQEAIRFGQRCENAGAVLRMFDRLEFAIGAAAQSDADIFATILLFFVGKGGAHRQRNKRLRTSAR